MPQKLNQEWKASLGVNAEAIHSTWLNRLANLTLLPQPFNSENSNNSFNFKCTHEHGFANNLSPLNKEIAAIGKCEHWGPEEMETRAQSLIKKALKLWPYPKYEQNDMPKEQSLSTETKKSVLNPALVKTQATTVAVQDADEAVLTPIHTGLQQSPFDEDIEPVSTQKGNSSEAKSQLQQDDIFDYCLADEPRDFAGTRLAGCEFLGQHYDVKKWAPLQRMLLTQIYQRNPERLRSWLAEKWGKFNLLAQLVTPEPNVTVARADVFEIDKGIYLNSHQPVYDKVKMLKQLFELMEIDPKELTLHIVKMRNKD